MFNTIYNSWLYFSSIYDENNKEENSHPNIPHSPVIDSILIKDQYIAESIKFKLDIHPLAPPDQDD